MKILVIRFSSIGDIVLTSPVLRCLKNQIQNCELHFLTKKKFYGLLEHNPHLSKILTFDSTISSVLPQLQSENYDLVIDLHHNIRSWQVKTALDTPSFSFDKLNMRKWLYVNFKMKLMPDIHIVNRYLDTLKTLGVEDDGLGLEFYPCDCDSINKEDLPISFQNSSYAVLSIGGTHFTKKMPEDQWVSLIQSIPIPLILVGGKEDFEAGNRIELEGKKLGKEIWNACGKFNIGGSSHLIKESVLVVSHDTGMMHIAAAFQKPIVAIWGNTVPQFGMYPFRSSHYNLEVKDLNCRPCSKIGYADCPKGHFNCMKNQNFNDEGLRNFIETSLSKTKVNG